VSFSPDNRFAYVNDLGGDCIHIYHLNAQTAKLAPAGKYQAKTGAGPRTLHFHPNGHTAYAMNELDTTIDVLEWHAADGSLTRVTRIQLMPEGKHVEATGCDTIISKDGRSVYFVNRGEGKPPAPGSYDPNFLYAFKADVKTGALTAIGRTTSGGMTPRNATLDPTERWMLVANQNSDWITVFARNPETGALSSKGKNFPAKTPMCILFA
jgi:6-phosphogluconolactonase